MTSAAVRVRPELGFALALQARLAPDAGTGFAWSPYSVAAALGLAAAGARGGTAAELAAALAPEGDLPAFAAGLAAGAALPGPAAAGEPAARLAVANTLWADRRLPIAPGYLDAVARWPGGAARAADFGGQPDAARREINADVERTTQGLVRDLLSPGDVDRRTRAVLVNALWLRASWVRPFDPRSRPAPFHAPTGPVQVPTMRVQARLGYAARPGWQLVSLPAGEGVRADLLLPAGDLAAAEPALTADLVADLLGAAAGREVELYLPRFRAAGQSVLNDALAAVGVGALFGPDADLSGITEAERLAVSAAVHKAVLTVDEQGLEGAAATALVLRTLSAVTPPPRPLRVRVDRPFLVLVRHEPSGALYFVARVTDPAG